MPVPMSVAWGMHHALLTQQPDLASSMRWVKWGNHHVTLRYLGFVPTESVNTIVEHVKQSVANTAPFGVEVDVITPFPSLSNPRLIVGHIKLNNEIKELFNNLQEGLLAAGINNETRPLRPHITLCRPKKRVEITTSPFSVNALFWTCDRISLYWSVRLSHRTLYVPIETIHLRGC